MERSIQKNGLVNLALALLIFLAGFGVTVFAGSLAGQTAAVFLGLGVLIAFISLVPDAARRKRAAGKAGTRRTRAQPRRVAV